MCHRRVKHISHGCRQNARRGMNRRVWRYRVLARPTGPRLPPARMPPAICHHRCHILITARPQISPDAARIARHYGPTLAISGPWKSRLVILGAEPLRTRRPVSFRRRRPWAKQRSALRLRKHVAVYSDCGRKWTQGRGRLTSRLREARPAACHPAERGRDMGRSERRGVAGI
jgi:hypothetical protein